MLTATYTLVALSVEQASVRVSLQSLQKVLYNNFVQQRALTPGQVDYACEHCAVHDACHRRKIEKFLFRRSTTPPRRRPVVGRARLFYQRRRLGDSCRPRRSIRRPRNRLRSSATHLQLLLQRLARECGTEPAAHAISAKPGFIANKMLARSVCVRPAGAARPADPRRGSVAGRRVARQRPARRAPRCAAGVSAGKVICCTSSLLAVRRFRRLS
jgi:hypothetical protein